MKGSQISHPILLAAAFCLLPFLLLLTSPALANTAPVVSDVTAGQRTDASGIVDVHYTLTDDDGDDCDITVVVSDDGGSSWNISPSALSGDLSRVSPGRRHIIWQSKTDLPWVFGTNYKIKVIADDTGLPIVPDIVGLSQADAEAAIVGGGFVVGAVTEGYSDTIPIGSVISQDPIGGEEAEGGSAVSLTISLGPDEGPDGMVWVYIDDSGAGMRDAYGPISHGGFNGFMSKYLLTNAQYAQYLNSAKADYSITVYNWRVYASTDTDHLEPYFDNYSVVLTTSQITYSAGSRTFSVRSRDGYSMADHPVVHVSWHGAKAFCEYYGYRLPTEWEWQAVADYDGSYTYGCGTTIDDTKMNYSNANPLGLSSSPYTSPVNHYLSYGYGMNDMAGNVYEWTDSLWDPRYSHRVLRSSPYYNYSDNSCTVWFRFTQVPDFTNQGLGFRVCR